MNRIYIVSNCLCYIFTSLLVIMPFLLILQWSTPSWLPSFFYPQPDNPIINNCNDATKNIQNWSYLTKLTGFTGDLLGYFPVFMGLLIMIKIMKKYKKREIFTQENALLYKKLGVLIFIYALLCNPLNGMMYTLAATWNNPPGTRILAFEYSGFNATALICGGVIFLISWVMHEASRLQDEQDLTV